ncbi:MAG: glycoside hydrolase family 3, partial [Oscillospiraceae bacterium]|nr:glycoside hydrolase family 3 [Oscillospiraceae bacterium]
ESSGEPIIEPEPEPELPDDPIEAKLAEMTLREKVYQMFFVTPEQLGGSYPVTTAMDATTRPVGGVLLMGANLKSSSQVKSMISVTQADALDNGIGLFFAVDEEGGKVARCASYLGATKLDPMAVYGERNSYNEAVSIGKTLGRDIGQFGFNVDFAPVADIDIHPNNELGDRIFSDDPDIVANMVSGVVTGLRSTGVCATLKHFPGLGAEDGNSHTASKIVIDRTLSELRNEEFVPFESGIGAGAEFVMVGHQTVTAFGDDLPADLSYTAVTTYLRGELGFTGIAITDAQNMGTITNLYYPGTAAKMAVKAGIDMILAPADLDAAANAVIAAVDSGEISEARIDRSVERILTLKYEMGLLDD